ncbi:MAG: hypothetical protein WC702_04910 [Patescibacteria group bacterium]
MANRNLQSEEKEKEEVWHAKCWTVRALRCAEPGAALFVPVAARDLRRPWCTAE